jgi:predicted ATPase
LRDFFALTVFKEIVSLTGNEARQMIHQIKIENFKSIQKQDILLNHLNVLIGPNGAGKSNFISLFRFLERLSDQQLSAHVFQSGGINNFLFNGYEVSDHLSVYLELTEEADSRYRNVYEFTITSDGESFRVEEEKLGFWDTQKYNHPRIYNRSLEPAQEAQLKLAPGMGNVKKVARWVFEYLKDLRLFHFHDTSDNAQMKLPQPIDDVYFLRSEAENLAPMLLHFRENHFDYYSRIVENVRLIYPLFHDFVLEESPQAKGRVMLRWKEKGSGQIFTAKQISDGTLRFICLAVLLIQPPGSHYAPTTLVLDEPELGLHPYAIRVLSELIQKISLEKQIIIATQSVNLVNYFLPEDLLVVDREDTGASVFRRLPEKDFDAWLEDYSLGQLWENNFLGGRP